MTSSDQNSQANDPMHSLTDSVAALLRQELRQAQQEMADKARQAAKGAGLLAGAGVLGGAALGTATTFVVRVFDRFLPRPLAAAVATASLGGAAAFLGAQGLAELRRLQTVVPEQTIRNVQADIDAARGTV